MAFGKNFGISGYIMVPYTYVNDKELVPEIYYLDFNIILPFPNRNWIFLINIGEQIVLFARLFNLDLIWNDHTVGVI